MRKGRRVKGNECLMMREEWQDEDRSIWQRGRLLNWVQD